MTTKTTATKEKTFEEKLEAEKEYWGDDHNYVIFKKLVKRGKVSRKTVPEETPFVLNLANASATAEAVRRYLGKGWPIVHCNFIEAPTTRDSKGNLIVDERIEEIRAFVAAINVQVQGAEEMKAKEAGTKKKYQERIAQNG